MHTGFGGEFLFEDEFIERFIVRLITKEKKSGLRLIIRPLQSLRFICDMIDYTDTDCFIAAFNECGMFWWLHAHQQADGSG